MTRPAPVVDVMIADYLSETSPRYTVGTYCAYVLRGAAKRYAGRYAARMTDRLESAVTAGTVARCRSVHGGTSYQLVTA